MNNWWSKPQQHQRLTWKETIGIIMCAAASVLTLIGAAVAAGWTI